MVVYILTGKKWGQDYYNFHSSIFLLVLVVNVIFWRNKMSEKEKFIRSMIHRGFHISNSFYGTVDLIPFHRKTVEGHHNIIQNIIMTVFDGSNTKKGELGCVVFYFGGTQRDKYHRQSHQKEILKKTFCPKTAKEALQVYDKWHTESQKMIKSWEVIL